MSTGMLNGIYDAGFTVWDTICGFAIKFVTANPFTVEQINGGAAGSMSIGGFRGIVQGAYNALIDITIPIATVLFILALFKIVISTPPAQQLYAFLGSAIKFGIIIALAANMWAILTGVSRVCAGVVLAVSDSAGSAASVVNLTMPADVYEVLTEGWKKGFSPYSAAADYLRENYGWMNWNNSVDIAEGILNIKDWGERALATMIGFLFAVLFFMACVACSVIILLTVFKRFIKPLIIAPFSVIAIATGAGGPEVSRSLSSFLRTFIGFILSGVIMILGFAVGTTIANLIDFGVTQAEPIKFAVLGSLKMMMQPILVTGLIKASDSITSKALGL